MRIALTFALMSLALAAQATTIIDPLNSPHWDVMHKRYLLNEAVVFDDKVVVQAPQTAEDSLNVPVSFQAEALADIEEIVVFADLNPLPLVLRFEPGEIKPNLAFRMKLQQASPVRVAAKTPDGVWHVGAVWIDAAGGGCTLPSVGISSGDWTETLGDVAARIWEREGGNNRLRVRVMHPMDTGLADGIPKFHIEQLLLKDTQTDAILATLELYEPVSENPMLSLDVGEHREFYLHGRDNNGNRINAELTQ